MNLIVRLPPAKSVRVPFGSDDPCVLRAFLPRNIHGQRGFTDSEQSFAFSPPPMYSTAMSKNAQAVLEAIKALPPTERRDVLEALQRTPALAPVKGKTMRHGRGMFAGSGLLEALLAERAKERAGN